MQFRSLLSAAATRRRAVLFAAAVLFGLALGGPASWGQDKAPGHEGIPLGVSAEHRVPPPAKARGAGSDDPAAQAHLFADAALSSSSNTPAARQWQLVKGRHWQIVGPAGEPPEITDARENNRGACGPGMIEVAGKMKQHFLLDNLQMQACTDWIDKKWPERCGAYDRDKWLALSKDLPTQPLHFCIDRFEYPNRRGEYPIILVSWYEARDTCASDGKRLCSEDEWTFACEGEEALPYPNGYVRDPDACLNDRPWRQFHDDQLIARSGENAKQELDRLWQGLPSGARPLCKSGFGVYDLTGNIDEWTRSSVANERQSVLKGGYWGPVRTRCRPATKAHAESHTFYQQGFRCCSDAP